MLAELLNAAEAAKPVLVKIIPVKLLRMCKKHLLKANFCRISKKRIPFQAGHDARGVNLIGNIKLEAGLGKSCRLVASILE